MGSQCLGPIACPLPLAAPLQSARLQTSVRHFLWGSTRRPLATKEVPALALGIPVIALLIVLLRCETQRAIG
jgi:hypothetical protein